MSLDPLNNKRVEESNNLKRSHTTVANNNIGKLYSLNDSDHLSVPRQKAIKIGRSRGNDIRIIGDDISGVHCELLLVWNEAIQSYYLNIIDHSTNGTFVNGSRISGKSILLKNGDKVNFAKTGAYVFRYKKDEESNGENKENKNVTKNNQKVSFFDEYVAGRQLGAGHYAVVKEAINKHTGKSYAVKIFKPQRVDDVKSTKQFNQELEVLMSIKHPNIVELVGTYTEPINKFSFTTYLVLEKVNSGELFTRIVKKQSLRQNETRAIFQQLLSGLEYLHNRDIIHRDIKPENILLNITPRTSSNQISTGPWDEDELNVEVKIADFGLAKFIGELKFTNTLCGTPAYVAPEVLGSTRKYSKNIDLWSAGVLLYVCVVGFPPFSDELGPPNMREQIIAGKYAFYSPYFDEIDDLVLDLISKLLVVDPNHRLNIRQTMEHPWFEASAGESYQPIVARSPIKGSVPRTYTELSKMQSVEEAQ
ncbi:DNA damage response protein kinase DUN1 [Wickerhamomyces ciferrii]|uniref:DNA damage response protein kinase DUN1 n=1 Tax=Wickerhamomyces ciferrii (strain ATCC 14091 / BCRC 22168 / CBS 111 / JCM 3599 / NBRC 0793 / NRRL Y-1031 F-60-10) TaxID=1206466 RepID=K0KI27_WICCF|nr:DNA damage response protein kinase DUN1 [Wickerhamomyces ciferrii]CCH42671.1 DNA damage response protein kinase DUN1 [Wickerhamomyces ciferrii]